MQWSLGSLQRTCLSSYMMSAGISRLIIFWNSVGVWLDVCSFLFDAWCALPTSSLGCNNKIGHYYDSNVRSALITQLWRVNSAHNEVITTQNNFQGRQIQITCHHIVSSLQWTGSIQHTSFSSYRQTLQFFPVSHMVVEAKHYIKSASESELEHWLDSVQLSDQFVWRHFGKPMAYWNIDEFARGATVSIT